jgi:hypothetical protein
MVSSCAGMLDETNNDDEELLQEELSPFPELSEKSTGQGGEQWKHGHFMISIWRTSSLR